MARAVAVVTDSTAYLDPHVAAERDIAVVPLQVVVDGRSMAEGREIGPATVAEALQRHERVSTSQPGPRAFLDAYESASASGASAIVSIHLSGQLSGTVDVARLAARDAPVPVEVIDSGSLGMGLGFAALAAADSADRGLAVDEVAAEARRRAANSSAYFYVDTLDYLRRGGRIGAGQALLGAALAVKPLLYLQNGGIQLLEKVRTSSRAVARLEDLAVARAGEDPVDVAVHHLANAVRADELAARLTARIPALGELVVTEVGAVIGAHVGPGLLAVIVSPR
ncbi:MAG TPA: DegV family protein [Jiangellaceae bacterium]|nr:DegV family protein [Jiangellaceae bacterium]